MKRRVMLALAVLAALAVSASSASVALTVSRTCAPVSPSVVVGISSGSVAGRPPVTVMRSSVWCGEWSAQAGPEDEDEEL